MSTANGPGIQYCFQQDHMVGLSLVLKPDQKVAAQKSIFYWEVREKKYVGDTVALKTSLVCIYESRKFL